MGRESGIKPAYEILAFITLDKERVLSSSTLALLAENEDMQKELTTDIAKAMKADVVKLKTGDYLVIRI